ncbi:unnamed protein product [Calicophoron daubneyi]|uniref:Cadherin domain-containing protein n=1 Tax=Calicophoron daubneyi TaxID=300641 RepID=A0AAV2TVQ2_CALDB
MLIGFSPTFVESKIVVNSMSGADLTGLSSPSLPNIIPIIITVDENTPKGTKIGRFSELIHPKPAVDTQFTIPSNQYFEADVDGYIRIIGDLDRDENRQLCSDPGYPLKCTWSSFAISTSGQYISVKVNINDVNDNVPTWQEHLIEISVPEETNSDYVVDIPNAKDPDFGRNGIQGYKLETMQQSDSDIFRLTVHKNTKKLTTSMSQDNTAADISLSLKIIRPLDREKVSSYTVYLLAYDGSEPYYTGTLTIVIKVVDENDHSPVFSSLSYLAVVSEDAPIGSVVELRENNVQDRQADGSAGLLYQNVLEMPTRNSVIASDKDEGLNAEIAFAFAASTDPAVFETFRLDERTGAIRVAKSLNYDSGPKEWRFQIVATDHGRPARSGSTDIFIKLKDSNTHGPTIKMRIQPPRLSGSVNYSQAIEVLSQKYPKRIFIPENAAPPTEPIAIFTVSDKDTGPGGMFVCELQSTNSLNGLNKTKVFEDFQLRFTGEIPNWKIFSLFLQKKLDRESSPIRDLAVKCIDKGDPPKESIQYLHVEVLDENDNAPQFLQAEYQLRMLEGNRPNVTVSRVKAIDPDDGENGRVSYYIQWPPESTESERVFHVNEDGKLIAAVALDREAKPRGYHFKVVARDNGYPRQFSSTVNVEVLLDDLNDCTPDFVEKEYNFTIVEDFGQNFSAARPVGWVNAVDCDIGLNALVTYAILDPGSPFTISDDGLIKTASLIDREVRPNYHLTVLAKDGGGGRTQSSNHIRDRKLEFDRTEGGYNYDVFIRQKTRTSAVQVWINVADLNDNYPIFVHPNSSFHQLDMSIHEEVGFIITRVVAIDKDAEKNGEVVYSIENNGYADAFRIAPKTGEIVLKEKLGGILKTTEWKSEKSTLDKQLITLTVVATDKGERPRSNSMKLRLILTDTPPLGQNLEFLETSHSFKSFGTEGDDTMGGRMEVNKMIMICIVISTAVVCLIMVFAIALYARRRSCRKLLRSRQSASRGGARREKQSGSWSEGSKTARVAAEQTGVPVFVDSGVKPWEVQIPMVAFSSGSISFTPTPLIYDKPCTTTSVTTAALTNILGSPTIVNKYVEVRPRGNIRCPTGIESDRTNSKLLSCHTERNKNVAESAEKYSTGLSTLSRDPHSTSNATVSSVVLSTTTMSTCSVHGTPTPTVQFIAVPVCTDQPSASSHRYRIGSEAGTCILSPSIASEIHNPDSDADSGRGGSVNNIGLSNNPELLSASTALYNPTDGKIMAHPARPDLRDQQAIDAQVQYLPGGLNLISLDGQIHVLTPSTSTSFPNPTVLLPIPNITDSQMSDSVILDSKPVTLSGESQNPLKPCHDSLNLGSLKKQNNQTSSPELKKRDSGPWRLIDLPTPDDSIDMNS